MTDAENSLPPAETTNQSRSPEPFDEVIATFAPQVQSTLRPRILPYVGWRGRFRCLWEITPEDGGVYVGQHAWEFMDYQGSWPGWVPTEDLADVEPVER
jgi:hypothetical protein